MHRRTKVKNFFFFGKFRDYKRKKNFFLKKKKKFRNIPEKKKKVQNSTF
jgi:hypothetical protein